MAYDKYFDIQFKDGGRDENGCDCFGLVRLILKQEFYKDMPSLEWLHGDTLKKQKEAVDKGKAIIQCSNIEKPMSGDIALIRIHGIPCHVGIFIDESHIMQIDKKSGVYVAKLESLKREGKIEGVYRVC